ncbi:hypothetical protein SAMN05661080_02592 [Modestobacter sp. DSM 44400]|nr:hypothetical protein SAMN05661080_02592 [Modestobacter sp. DSM 44400]
MFHVEHRPGAGSHLKGLPGASRVSGVGVGVGEYDTGVTECGELHEAATALGSGCPRRCHAARDTGARGR